MTPPAVTVRVSTAVCWDGAAHPAGALVTTSAAMAERLIAAGIGRPLPPAIQQGVTSA